MKKTLLSIALLAVSSTVFAEEPGTVWLGADGRVYIGKTPWNPSVPDAQIGPTGSAKDVYQVYCPGQLWAAGMDSTANSTLQLTFSMHQSVNMSAKEDVIDNDSNYINVPPITGGKPGIYIFTVTSSNSGSTSYRGILMCKDNAGTDIPLSYSENGSSYSSVHQLVNQ